MTNIAESMRRPLIIAIYDPQWFIHILDSLKKRRIPFTVYEDVNTLPYYGILYTDYEYFVNEVKTRNDITVVYDPIHDCKMFERAVLATRFKNEYNEVIFGIDPGSRYTLVVIGDEDLLDYINASSLSDLMNYLMNHIRCFPSRNTIIRIGSGVNGWKIALALRSKLSTRIEIVDEDETTPKNNRLDEEVLSRKFLMFSKVKHRYRDIYAAIKIAMRRGIEVD
ncbi:MAG: hypothetical protein ABWW65_00650 [Thermoprotei archaeon]